MIASLAGTVQKIESGSLILHVGGVGIRVYVPRTVLEDVGGVGRRMTLHTHLLVREDGLTLYGFENEEDLQLFEVLLGVNGVGPKVALSILGTLSPELLKSAIMREETAVLQRVPGIGKKTAERLLLELRDKLGKSLPALAASVPGKAAAALPADPRSDILNALLALGYNEREALTAMKGLAEDAGVSDGIRHALKQLSRA